MRYTLSIFMFLLTFCLTSLASAALSPKFKVNEVVYSAPDRSVGYIQAYFADDNTYIVYSLYSESRVVRTESQLLSQAKIEGYQRNASVPYIDTEYITSRGERRSYIENARVLHTFEQDFVHVTFQREITGSTSSYMASFDVTLEKEKLGLVQDTLEGFKRGDKVKIKSESAWSKMFPGIRIPVNLCRAGASTKIQRLYSNQLVEMSGGLFGPPCWATIQDIEAR